MSEGQLKIEIRKYLTGIGAFWSNVQGGPGSKPGDPDIVVCYKGYYIGLEAKTPTGVQSPIQKRRMSEIRDAGGIYEIVRSLDDVKRIMEKI
jgi:hypothetical protein